MLTAVRTSFIYFMHSPSSSDYLDDIVACTLYWHLYLQTVLFSASHRLGNVWTVLLFPIRIYASLFFSFSAILHLFISGMARYFSHREWSISSCFCVIQPLPLFLIRLSIAPTATAATWVNSFIICSYPPRLFLVALLR